VFSCNGTNEELVGSNEKNLNLDIDLFNNGKQEYFINDSIKICVKSIENFDSLKYSNFVLVINNDTLYKYGFVLNENLEFGYVGKCENSTRFYFEDTTFQTFSSNEYCVALLTNEDKYTAIDFNRITIVNNKVTIPVYSLENVYGIYRVLFVFNSKNILNELNLLKK